MHDLHNAGLYGPESQGLHRCHICALNRLRFVVVTCMYC